MQERLEKTGLRIGEAAGGGYSRGEPTTSCLGGSFMLRINSLFEPQCRSTRNQNYA
jgi:hypothetical protein